MDKKITDLSEYRKDRVENPALTEVKEELSDAFEDILDKFNIGTTDISEVDKFSDTKIYNKDNANKQAGQDFDNSSFWGEKSINKIIAKLIFVGLLFLLIVVFLSYLFASNSGDYSSELPKQISLLIIGILAMIAWIGYGWIARK